MARFTFKLPDIGEGISEAEIVAWHVAVGDRVEEDQGLADMMTDKATVEMESPVAGVVVELAGEVGDQVSIGAALVVIETDAAEAVADAAPAETKAEEAEEQIEAETPGAGEVAEKPSPHREEGSGEAQSQAPSPETAPLPAPLPPGEREKAAHVLASPAVRARAADLG
ncbi:MAG: biotin/lipoyl-containing protein, partial [Pseudomonadota bacterium]